MDENKPPEIDPTGEIASDEVFDEEAQREADLERVLGRERFVQARFDAGYVRADVDRMAAAVRDAVAAGKPIEPVLERHPLPMAGFRDGYEVADVENWIAQLADLTDADVSQRQRVLATAHDWTERPAKKERDRGAANDGSGVISEQRGFFGRFRRNR